MFKIPFYNEFYINNNSFTHSLTFIVLMKKSTKEK